MTGACRKACRMTGKKDLYDQLRVAVRVEGTVPEETNKTDKLDQDACYRPLHEDQDAVGRELMRNMGRSSSSHAAKEAHCPSPFFPTGKEVECLLRSDNEG